MFHHESWKPIYFGVKRSKVKPVPAWLFALVWVLVSRHWFVWVSGGTMHEIVTYCKLIMFCYLVMLSVVGCESRRVTSKLGLQMATGAQERCVCMCVCVCVCVYVWMYVCSAHYCQKIRRRRRRWWWWWWWWCCWCWCFQWLILVESCSLVTPR